MADEQISIPSLLFILVISGLFLRYVFFKPSTPAQQQSQDPAAASRSREAAVDTIQAMFPQVERRTILWDLQRTRGNVAATTERILSGSIETPPITFQPLPPPSSATPPISATSAQKARPPKPAEPDLITRYNLQNKVGQSSTDETPAVSSGSGTGSSNKKAWSTSRDERQSALQKRRDEMILAARRKMEAKIAAEKTAASGPSGSS